MAAKLTASEMEDAVRRIRLYRNLLERLIESESKLEFTYTDWDRQPLVDSIRSLRREMTRQADDVHRDLSRRGGDAATLYLRDAPVLGGRKYSVPLVQALVDGSARAYNVTPDTVNIQFEAAICL